MFNRRWEKAPHSRFNCLKNCHEVLPGIRLKRARFFAWGVVAILAVYPAGFAYARGTTWDVEKFTTKPFFSTLKMIISNPSAQTNSSPPRPLSRETPPQNPKVSGDSEQTQSQRPPSHQKPSILVPEIPDKDNGQVIVAYKTKIEETQALMRTIIESQLTKEQHDTLISIHSFLEKAQEAFSQDDMPMAVNLAEKAHTLTKEIVKNSPKP